MYFFGRRGFEVSRRVTVLSKLLLSPIPSNQGRLEGGDTRFNEFYA
jgi:hypothetical protein